MQRRIGLVLALVCLAGGCSQWDSGLSAWAEARANASGSGTLTVTHTNSGSGQASQGYGFQLEGGIDQLFSWHLNCGFGAQQWADVETPIVAASSVQLAGTAAVSGSGAGGTGD